MSFPKTLLLIGLLATTSEVVAQETVANQPAHLFILSGQSNMAGLDPNASFTPTVAKEFGEENVIVVKDAKGGEPIHRWYKDWQMEGVEAPRTRGALYDRLMKKVRAAIDHRKLASVTFVWMQGERDAREKFGPVYAESLKGLLNQLSADLSRNDINCVIGRLSDFDMANKRYPHWTMVRDAQVEFAKRTPRCIWVDTDDLNDGMNRRGKPIKDDLHYSAKGYESLGRRFAHKAIDLIQETRRPNISLNGKDYQGIARSSAIQPAEADYSQLAFYPDRWKKANVDFDMLAWEGSKVVFMTKKGDYDAAEVTAFVNRLDDGWQTYSEMIGQQPRQLKMVSDKPVICAIPNSNLSCGYGCGFVGATGIEVSAFYSVDLPNFQKQPDSFQHYYFYEMGRNFFVFGDRHSLFTTGFAVFMRYVCMDRLECKDLDSQTRRTIENCEEIYAKSDIGFFEAFTNLGFGEKSNRLKDASGRVISPSDQPVMYATAMLKLRRDCGGDEWVKKFCHTLRRCRPARADDIESAGTQVFNWLVCASVAAGKDLTPVFADRWRMPLTDQQRQILQQTDWAVDNVDVTKLVADLVADNAVAHPEKKVSRTQSAKPHVVPAPASIRLDVGAKPCLLDRNSRILVSSAKDGAPLLEQHGKVLASELEILTGLQVPAVVGTDHAKPNDIVLSVVCRAGQNIDDESYQLVAGKNGILISADSFRGVTHGTSSLLQLIDSDSLAVPAVTIEDRPAAPYRAVMVDVAREPHSIGVIKDAVRLCRLYKLRFLQLHLTDNQHFTFPFAPVTDNLERNFHYTVEELQELVAYADARGVTIIPELDLPGHSERLKASGYLAPSETDADVASPKNYEKIGKLIDAMIDVFSSSPYFHIGGDESGAGRGLIPFLAEVNKRIRREASVYWSGKVFTEPRPMFFRPAGMTALS